MRNKPSEHFLGAILRGYDAEMRTGKPYIAPSGIWDRIVMEAFPVRGAFNTLFEWDPRKGKVNRIGTIRDCIAKGYVPGLRLAKDAKGREIVEKVVIECDS